MTAHTTTDSIADVAVVGGGPAGLVAALALSCAGRSVVHLAPPPPTDRRTSALLQGSVELLDRLGVWAAVRPQAAALRTMRLVDGSRRLLRAPETRFDASEIDLDAFGWNVENHVLTTALAARVADESAIRSLDAVARQVTVRAGCAEILTGDGDLLRARLVVGADGRRSLVRDAAGIATRERRYDQVALVLNCRHDGPHRDTSTEFHTETGPFTLVPLGSGRSSIVLVERPAVAERLVALSDAELGAELSRRSQRLLGTIEVDGPRQTYPLSSLKAASMSAPRVALVGEAAHAFPPIGAQGLNLGIRDVAELAKAVGRAGGDCGADEVLAAYARARRFDVASRQAGVDLLNRSLLTDFLPVQFARGLALQAARTISPLRRLLMREGLAPDFRPTGS